MSRDALVVGINSYTHFNDLTSPAKDAEAIAQLLEGYGHFTTVNRLPPIVVEGEVKVGRKDPVTRQMLRTAISQLFNPTSQNQAPDTALLYFSGHGWQSTEYPTDHYLASSDANPAEDIGVDLRWLRLQLDKSPVRQQIIWLDCCNSGGLLNFDEVLTGKQGQVRERHFITASRDFENSYHVPGSPYSVLTKVLLEGLDPTRTDTGEVTSVALNHYLETALKPKIQGFQSENTGGTIQLTHATAKRQSPTPQPLKKLAMPLQMPPLPDHFVERPDHQQEVKDQLLSDDPKVFGTLVVSAIYGLGGIGKSVLASKLAHDQTVQDRFCDGILWATLGQSPDLLPLLSGWIQALGDNDYKPTAIESASVHLRTLLYDKKALLVVDDVWNPEHLEPFRVGGSDCCVLVTTREARIPEAHRYDLDVMSPEQSLELMTQKLSEPLTEAEKGQALSFAERVGHLPLALELAASQIEEGVTWAELLEDFTAEVVRLEALDLYGREDMPDDAKRRKYSLYACFNLSLKQLSTEQLRQFAWLGIVPEDVNLTQEMATTLWQVTSRQAGSILRQLGSKALLLSGVKEQGNRRTYRLHDLMHDLAQQLLTDPPHPTATGNLPGLGLTKAEAHDQFLARYRAKTHQGQWHTLQDDGYIYDRLTWHMEQAKRPDEIDRVLQASNDAGRNGWYDACDGIGKPAGFVNDLGRGWRLAVANYEHNPETTLTQLFRYALMRTSINSLASNVPAELVGELVKHEVWQPAQGLAYAQQAQNPWQRAACISALVPYMPEALLPEVLTTIGQIHDAAYRSYVLGKLAERFPKYWTQALASIREIQDRYGDARNQTQGFSYRAMALSHLLPQLPSELLPEAIEITRQIQDESDRARALRELAKQRPELLAEALEVTRAIQSESSRARALRELAKQLPPELLAEALEVTRAIQSESYRARALRELAKQLPELLPEALEVTRAIQDESYRAWALRELAKQLPPELLAEALEVTRAIQDESYRAWALRELAKQLPPELLAEALEVTRAIQSESSRAWALRELAKQRPELLAEALEVTRAIQDESYRARALSELAKQRPELLAEALEVTRAIQDESSRAWALSELAKQCPELLAEALEVTRAIQDESSRAWALRELAKQRPELLAEALEVTRAIQDESSRARALSELAKQLPPELLAEALEVTRAIQDESSRASALSELTQQLPPELLPEAFESMATFKDTYFCAQAWSGLLKRLEELAPDFPCFIAILETLAYQNRQGLLGNLPDLHPTLTRLGGDQTLDRCLQVIRDVCQQWP